MGPEQLAPGSLFAGRFLIERLAGSGGMGTVYRARDEHRGGLVALKLLQGGDARPDEADRFTREAQLLAELHHPGIVAHIDHGQTAQGHRFLAMEWLDGEDLAQRLRRGPLTLGQSLTLLDRTTAALASAHERGVVHRDLKPSNLFLCGGDLGHVKILDFGIARRIARTHPLTQTGVVIGTAEYMSPEQARGSRELQPAADLFALGCVLYECLTGQPPFVADHLAAVLVRILFEDPLPVEERRPGIPPPVLRILARLLAKDPAQRPRDAAELRQELRGLGELAEPPPAETLLAAAPPAAFAQSEQHLISLVLAALPEVDRAVGLHPTLPRSALGLEEKERQSLQQALRQLGTIADYLANGALVVTVPLMASAQDQATLALHAALLIKGRWPAAVVALATGRGVLSGRTVVGEVAEQAARILQQSMVQTESGSDSAQALPSGVFVDSLTAQLLAGRAPQLRPVGGLLLLTDEKEADSSRPLLGKPTPCVGRETELLVLDAELTACIDDREARAILIKAVPGIGKSRLRHEFLRRTEKRPEPVTVLLGCGELLAAGAPYGILAAMLRRLCGLSGSEPLLEQQARLHARLSRQVAAEDKERVVLLLAELCNIPFAGDTQPILQAARRDAKLMRDALRRAWLDWLSGECAAAPVLLVLDDLQWGDALSIALVDDALRELRGAPLFILALSRPEIQESFPKLWAGCGVQEIALKPLTKRACERLMQQVLGPGVDAETIGRTVEQAGGNALFLEEMIRAIAEGKPADQPETVMAMLQARIGRLDSGPRRAVRAAAVFGQTFWHGGVAAILDLPPAVPEVEHDLLKLIDAELIVQHASSRLPAEPEYGFRHALIRDAACSLLLPADLQLGHQRAGRYLLAVGESDLRAIAEHLERGGLHAEAAQAYVQAADHCMKRADFLGTLANAECAIRCGATGETLGLVRGLQAEAYFFTTDRTRLSEAAHEAVALLPPGSLRWYKSLWRLIAAEIAHGNAAIVDPWIHALLHSEPQEGARDIYLEALGVAISVLCTACRFDLARVLLARSRELHRDFPHGALQPGLLVAESQYLRTAEPDPFRQLECLRGALTYFNRIHHTEMVAIMEDFIGEAYGELGDFDRGEAILRASLQRAEKAKQGYLVVHAQLHLAALLVASGDDARCAEAGQLVRRVLFGKNSPTYSEWSHSLLARVLQQQGEPLKAEAEVQQALSLPVTAPLRRLLVLSTLIESLLAQTRWPEAREHVQQLQAELTRLGSGGYAEIRLRLIAAEALTTLGEPAAAARQLRLAGAEIRQRADKIPDPEVRARYLRQVPENARVLSLLHHAEPNRAADSTNLEH